MKSYHVIEMVGGAHGKPGVCALLLAMVAPGRDTESVRVSWAKGRLAEDKQRRWISVKWIVVLQVFFSHCTMEHLVFFP